MSVTRYELTIHLVTDSPLHSGGIDEVVDRRRDPDKRTTAPEKLAALAAVGIGELRAQGFGRFVVGHPLLEKETFTLRSLHGEDLAPTADGAAASEEAQR